MRHIKLLIRANLISVLAPGKQADFYFVPNETGPFYNQG